MIIKNTNILQIQCFFDNTIRIDSLCAEGIGRLDVSSVLIFPFNSPFARNLGEMHLDVILCPPWRGKRFKHKLFHIVRVQPRCTQSYGNFACRKVFGLYLLQCRNIGLKAFVFLCFDSCKGKLFPHIARKVFIGSQIFFRCLSFFIFGVQKNNILQIRKDFFLAFSCKLLHICHIHLCLFADGNGKGFCGIVGFLNSLMATDGSLSKEICLSFQLSVLIQNFQRTK